MTAKKSASARTSMSAPEILARKAAAYRRKGLSVAATARACGVSDRHLRRAFAAYPQPTDPPLDVAATEATTGPVPPREAPARATAALARDAATGRMTARRQPSDATGRIIRLSNHGLPTAAGVLLEGDAAFASGIAREIAARPRGWANQPASALGTTLRLRDPATGRIQHADPGPDANRWLRRGYEVQP